MLRCASPPVTHWWTSDGFDDYCVDSRPATATGILSRPGSPLISSDPLLFKFRPSTSPTPPKGRALTLLRERDKESLLDEIHKLNQAINEQAAYMRRQRMYASKLRSHNRRLERNVDELELLGTKAPRTGGPRRLRTMFQGLKGKLGGLQVNCVCQEEQIFQLRKDLRVTVSRETQVERDVFAGEVARLQNLVKQLRLWKSKLANENKEIERLRDKNLLLEVANGRLAASIQAAQGSVLKTHEDMDVNKRLLEKAVVDAHAVCKQYEECSARNKELQMLLVKEKAMREKLQKRANSLSVKILKSERVQRELARKASKQPVLNLKGGGCDGPSELGPSEVLYSLGHKVPRLNLRALRSREVERPLLCKARRYRSRSRSRPSLVEENAARPVKYRRGRKPEQEELLAAPRKHYGISISTPCKWSSSQEASALYILSSRKRGYCSEWLETLNIPLYAEDTLQMLQLNRPVQGSHQECRKGCYTLNPQHLGLVRPEFPESDFRNQRRTLPRSARSGASTWIFNPRVCSGAFPAP